MFGWAVDSKKAAVNCELWKNCCELRTVDFLKIIWLYQLWTVGLVENIYNTHEALRDCLYANWSKNFHMCTNYYVIAILDEYF
jgi:hypothetical protein